MIYLIFAKFNKRWKLLSVEYLVMTSLVERLQASRSSQKQTPPLQPWTTRLGLWVDLFWPHLEVSVLQEVNIPPRGLPPGNTILLDPAIVGYLGAHPVIRSISVSELIAPLVHSKYNFFIIVFFAKIFPTGRSPCRSEPCYNPSAWRCSPASSTDCQSVVTLCHCVTSSMSIIVRVLGFM